MAGPSIANFLIWFYLSHETNMKFLISCAMFLFTISLQSCSYRSIPTVDCSEKPELILKVEPIYPRMALQAGLEGIVHLNFTVDRTGHVKNIEIITSGVLVLDDAAQRAVSQYQYAPPACNGHTIESQVSVVIEFKLP